MSSEGEASVVALGRRWRRSIKAASVPGSPLRLRFATSPLLRCRTTARLLARSLGADEDAYQVFGLLDGQGILPTSVRIRLAQEGLRRVLNRELEDEAGWLDRFSQTLAFWASDTLNSLAETDENDERMVMEKTPVKMEMGKTPVRVGIAVTSPELSAAFLAWMLALLEIPGEEGGWPRPLEPALLQLQPQSGDLCLRFRGQSRSLTLLTTASQTVGRCQSCCIL